MCCINFPTAKEAAKKSSEWTDKELQVINKTSRLINAAAVMGNKFVDVELPMYDKVLRFLEQKGYRLEYHPWSIICRIHW